MTESSEDIFVTKQGIRNDTFCRRGAFTNLDRQIENQIIKNQIIEDNIINLAQHILCNRVFATGFVHIISKRKCRSKRDKKFYVQFRGLLYLLGCIF